MQSLPHLVREIAKAGAHRPALFTPEGRSWTYGDVEKQIDDLVAALRAQGIRRHDRVVVAYPAGIEMAALFLGVSAAAACAPLNPASPLKEFGFYLDALQPRAALLPTGSTSPLAEAARSRGIPVLFVESTPAGSPGICRIVGSEAMTGEKDATNGDARREEARPDDVALILHTSGTTSRPKRVPLTHANLCASARNIARTLRLTPDDRCLNVMPLFHIHGLVGGLLSSLAAGSALVCAPGFEQAHFLDWARDSRATWYTAVPTIHQSVLEAAASHPEKAAAIRFRFIRSSSSALPPSVMDALEQTWGAPVVESYGMSEAAHQVTSNPLPPARRKPGSVGLPAGPEVGLIDKDGQFVQGGQKGEVVIRGASVTRGYEQNPAANAEAFTEGWLRTGDQGHFDEEGYLFLTGRLKEMINRGGENIAPREIDEALLAHPAVMQAVAFAVPHETLGEYLAAAVTLKPGSETDEQALRQFAAKALPGFKVPSQILMVDEIPKGPTGKLQRIGLHERLSELLVADYAPPASDEEWWVADAFSTVLQRERVGRDDNFFALGGDSLRAVRTVVLLQPLLSQDLSLALLFEGPTPALLGAALARLRAQEAKIEALARELEGFAVEDIQRLLSESAAS